MTSKDLENAIIDTEEEWAEDVLPADYGKKQKRRWLKPAVVTAACALAAVLAVVLWPRNGAPATAYPSAQNDPVSSASARNEEVRPVTHAFALTEAQYPEASDTG